METDAERLNSIQALGGIRIWSARGAFVAIFDRQYTSANLGDLDVESRSPALTCRTCDVAHLGKDSMVQIADVSFRILRTEPESPAPGWSVLILRS